MGDRAEPDQPNVDAGLVAEGRRSPPGRRAADGVIGDARLPYKS